MKTYEIRLKPHCQRATDVERNHFTQEIPYDSALERSLDRVIRYFAVDGVDALGSPAAKQFDKLHNSAFYLKRHEGKTLEYKRDLSSPESILKCLVAFANTGGGIVVIGVEDG